ncbi:MAG: hypothetical protein ACHREM_13470 [Polyangiales bacterium]
MMTKARAPSALAAACVSGLAACLSTPAPRPAAPMVAATPSVITTSSASAVPLTEQIERLRTALTQHPDDVDSKLALAGVYETLGWSLRPSPDDPDRASKLRAALGPAEEQYRALILGEPKLPRREVAYYRLGSLLSETDRGMEGRMVWRALVCANHYEYPLRAPASDAEATERAKWKDGVAPMVQDHSEAYWAHWRDVHYAMPTASKKPAKARMEDEETFRDPYPDDCAPLTASEALAPALGRVWFELGQFHAARGDELAEESGYVGASPYQYNRAASALRHALASKGETLHTFATFRLAQVLASQSRWTEACAAYVALLARLDQVHGSALEDETIRAQALHGIAASLARSNMIGPRAEDPLQDAEDDFSKYTGRALQTKLSVAITRVQDPTFVPQDKPWTPKVYKALATHFEFLDLRVSESDTLELILRKWPCAAEAPTLQSRIAEAFDVLALQAESPAERSLMVEKALEARAHWMDYVGVAPWTECNNGDAGALANARGLARAGMRAVASRRTVLARGHSEQASAFEEGSTEAATSLRHARDEYRLAEKAWLHDVIVDPDPKAMLEATYWIADARRGATRATRRLGEIVDPAVIESGLGAAIEVRDSTDHDNPWSHSAAQVAIDLLDESLLEQVRVHEASGCKAGVGVERRLSPLDEPGDACRTEVERIARPTRSAKPHEMPPIVLRARKARTDAIAAITPARDVDGALPRWRFEIADLEYEYGALDEATAALEEVWRSQCGKNEYGSKAWERLVVLARTRWSDDRSKPLLDAALAHSCARTEAEKLRESVVIDPIRIAKLHAEAESARVAAHKEKDAARRAEKLLVSERLFALALELAPAHDDAPRSAIRWMETLQELSDPRRAHGVARFFLRNYGRDADLAALRDGDAARGIKRDVARYKLLSGLKEEALGALRGIAIPAPALVTSAETLPSLAPRPKQDDHKVIIIPIFGCVFGPGQWPFVEMVEFPN